MDFDSNDQERNIIRYNNSPIHSTQALDPMLAAIGKNYFGIDLEAIPNMSDADVGDVADRVEQMDRLRELTPILEKHFQKLIDGQVEYEQFLTDIQSEISKGAKKIDKNILDSFTLKKGYQAHTKLMAHKSRNEDSLIDSELVHALDFESLTFSNALKVSAHKYQVKSREENKKLPTLTAREDENLKKRDKKRQRRDRWQNGNSKGFWDSLGDFFGGNA